MRHPATKRKCQYCKTFFAPDPRSAGRQRYCSKPACRQASKAASQRRWYHKPHNRDYFCGPIHVDRVRQWRQAHPGYWRHQGSRTPDALQDELAPQETQKQQLAGGLTPHAKMPSSYNPLLWLVLSRNLPGSRYKRTSP
jgi:hypothetical protein